MWHIVTGCEGCLINIMLAFLQQKQFSTDKREAAICKLEKKQKRKSIARFSISVLPADWHIFFLGAVTRLCDDDFTFECFTTECFTLWAEIPE